MRTIPEYGHPRRDTSLCSEQGIFDDRAAARIGTHPFGRIEIDIRRGLRVRHLRHAEQAALEARQQTGQPQREAHLFQLSARRHAHRYGNRIERILDTRHRLQAA